MAIRSNATALNLAGKITHAQRIWSARNPTYSQAFRSIITPEPMPPAQNILRRGEASRTTNVGTPQVTREDPIEALTKQIAQLSINLADMQQRPAQNSQRQLYNTQKQAFTANTEWGPRPQGQWQQGPRTCYNCGEEGHIAMYCRAETKKIAQPSNATRTNDFKKEPSGTYMAGREQIGDEIDTYPVFHGDKGKARTQILGTKKPVGRPPKARATAIIEESDDEKMQDEDLVKATENMIRNSRSPSINPSEEGKKLRKSKSYKYDIFQDIMARKVEVTIGELLEISTYR